MSHDANNGVAIKIIGKLTAELHELAILAEKERISKLNGEQSHTDFSFNTKYFQEGVINIL